VTIALSLLVFAIAIGLSALAAATRTVDGALAELDRDHPRR
jgi:hypothetical protein